ncbi:MAG: THUMP domain-containing protein [Candidatus Hodarchaeota archaeon]
MLICGDKYPIITGIQFSGLITALTNLNPKSVILRIKKILERKPNFFQFILKIVPIDFICETNIKTLDSIIQENFKEYINEKDTFKITLKRRHHEKIERNKFIEEIAKKIDNKVDLENPDKIIRIEILGNISGVAFLKKNEIVKIT